VTPRSIAGNSKKGEGAQGISFKTNNSNDEKFGSWKVMRKGEEEQENRGEEPFGGGKFKNQYRKGGGGKHEKSQRSRSSSESEKNFKFRGLAVGGGPSILIRLNH